ncbi:LysM peptidoglycan-binding and 3D domain-containing protein [Bacillus sp. EB600]|uniref:LysM peptidoglycan-binding and 3D domain-containing protein n=1 Tax=Bacillus sp. EB600 TaxID=2806345 RepID=UPI00210C2DD9|nr:LysM peptidoglycan-binding and 3D domain-containing protein [Bacillus sp. EB600]MCQ6278499.1 LysM peptidoglycan-binding domain-containing protein [Bacillus sp. EB600]
MLNKIKTIIAVAVLSGTVSANAEAATVTVQKGDTLWDLSRVHNSSVENIQKLNHLTTDLIHPGDVLTITQETQYTVKQGDTLWDIAMAHHVSAQQIMEWNKLMTDLIHPGLTLVIYDGSNTTNNAVTEKTIEPAAPTSTVPSTTPAAAPEPAAPAPQPTAQASEPATAAPAPQPAKQAPSAPAAKAAPTSSTGSKEITVRATAYTASCEGCSGITATGIDIKANPNEKVIAVDPSVIPLGSKVYVEGFGEATAADTGGAIKGNRIDVFIPSEQDAINFGVKQVKVTLLN